VTVTRRRGTWWKPQRVKWEIDGTVDTLASHTEHKITLGAEGGPFDGEDTIPYKRGDTYSVLVTYYASHSSRKRRKRLRATFSAKTKSIEIY